MSADTAELHAVLARLDRLEAQVAARSLLAEYAKRCDANDSGAVSELFEPDATLTVAGGAVTGRTAIAAWYLPRLSGATKHLVTNVDFTGEDGLGAISLRSEFLAIVQLDAGPSLTWGTYVDNVHVVNGPGANGRATFIDRAIHLDGRSGPIAIVADAASGTVA